VGFGFAHELLAAPQQVQADVTLARETIYWAAQQRDPYPGGAYPGADPFMEGTSVVSASDVMRELGYYTAVHWALTFADLIAALGHYGPVVIGVDWYEGMSMPDADGFIRPTGLIRGGHCVCLVGIQFNSVYIPEIDHAKSWVIVHNSWGPDWGDGGRAKLSLADLAVLWPGGDFCIPVRAYS
jgi:C1A family cysteine protease